MDDKILTERDIHGLVKIFQKDSNLILNKDVLCGALGLTLGEHEEISSRVQMERAGSYKYLSLVLNKWIGLNGDKVTVKSLAIILKQEDFNSTADELLKTLGGLPIPNTHNNKTETNSTIVNTFNNSEVQVQVPESSNSTVGPESELSNTLKILPTPNSQGNVATIVKKFNTIEPDQLPKSSPVVKKPNKTETVEIPVRKPKIQNNATAPQHVDEILHDSGKQSVPGMTNEMTQVSHVSQREQAYVSKKDKGLKGSQNELIQFLRMNTNQFSTLRTIEFDNVEMRADHFMNSIQHMKTVESIKLTNLRLHDYFDSSRKFLLPNMKEYVVGLQESSSQKIMDPVRQNFEDPRFPDRLIFFAIKNTSEETWNTCLNLRHIQLMLVLSVQDSRTFKIDKSNLELVVDRVHGYYLPQILKAFHGLKKLTLTNFNYNFPDLSCIPSSVTDLSVIAGAISPITNIHISIKSMKNLTSINYTVPVSLSPQTFDLSFFSPQLRYLSLRNVTIKSTSMCQFKHLEMLILNECNLEDISMNIPFMFKSVKKCYFRVIHRSVIHLQKLLEIAALQLIVVRCSQFTRALMKEIVSKYGVPPNIDSFDLEKNEGQWKFVSLNEDSENDIFRHVYTGGMDIKTLHTCVN